MENEEQVVNTASQATVESTTTEEEQASTASESVNTQDTDGKDYKAMYENARKALKIEREKRHTVETQPEQPEYQQEEATDDGVRRFLQTEADAYIARKAVTDPSFRELLPEIEALMRANQGMDIRTAETQVKVAMFESISNQINHESTQNIPNQIKTTATQEPVQKQATLEELDPILARALKETGF